MLLPNRVWPAAVRSLQCRNFRILWLGLLISSVGTWMQIVAQSLLVLRLSHNSGFALGFVSLAQALAFFLFALAGGGFADRLERRRLLLCTQSLLMLLAFVMGLLTFTGRIQFWMIVNIAFFAGAILSFDQPARAALMSSLVPKKDLLNAISLQSAVFNSASVIGPVFAGITVDRIGLSANFFLNALSFVAALTSILILRPPKATMANVQRKLLTEVREALLAVKCDAVLPWLLLSYGILLFSGPSLPLLLPILAIRNLGISPSALGFLFSAAGIGAVLGAIFLASLSDALRKGTLILGAFALWTISLAVIGYSRDIFVTFTALVFFGLAQSVIGAITSTVLQTRVTQQMRGRVMSLNTLVIMGVRPLGDFPAGALISLWGAPLTAAVSAIVVGATALSLFLGRPALRTL